MICPSASIRSVLDDPAARAEDLVAALTAAERAKNELAALQARLAVRLDETVRRHHREDLRLPAVQQGRGVASEVALARRESPVRGQRHLGLAAALVRELPCTLAAMEAGELTEEQATIVARETACLDPGDRAVVDRTLCGTRDDGSYPFVGWSILRLAHEVVAAVAAIDAAALVERRARAEADRHVSVRPKPDAMAQVSALLPAARAVAVVAALRKAADAAVAAGDPRSRSQVQADTLVERVTGQSAAELVPLRVNITVSDSALTGGSQQPGWLAGYGTVSAAHVRDLVGAASTAGVAAWRRIYTDPVGRLVAMEAGDRLFGRDLTELFGIRDQVCRTPWCDAPIRHGDHITPHAAGGATTEVNGQGLCEMCNHAKQAPGWRSVTVSEPESGRHTVEIVTPAGQHVRSSAPPLPIPDRLERGAPPRVLVEIYTDWPTIVLEPAGPDWPDEPSHAA